MLMTPLGEENRAARPRGASLYPYCSASPAMCRVFPDLGLTSHTPWSEVTASLMTSSTASSLSSRKPSAPDISWEVVRGRSVLGVLALQAGRSRLHSLPASWKTAYFVLFWKGRCCSIDRRAAGVSILAAPWCVGSDLLLFVGCVWPVLEGALGSEVRDDAVDVPASTSELLAVSLHVLASSGECTMEWRCRFSVSSCTLNSSHCFCWQASISWKVPASPWMTHRPFGCLSASSSTCPGLGANGTTDTSMVRTTASFRSTCRIALLSASATKAQPDLSHTAMPMGLWNLASRHGPSCSPRCPARPAKSSTWWLPCAVKRSAERRQMQWFPVSVTYSQVL
mmetsp:Transcript_39600/g.112051  ORF Transcript_39600/g.112051 Transcript_39600/m.112051 type:complete len:339 (-) Transcript_39600:818-1834(-)